MMWYKVPHLEIKRMMLGAPAGIHVTQRVKQTSSEKVELPDHVDKVGVKNIIKKYQEMRA